MTAQRDRAWVGIDVGKTHHWACVVDAKGTKLLSIKVANDEADIMAFIDTTDSQAAQLDWAVDIIGAPSALLLALLARADQTVRYASGRVVAAMSAAYAGEGKTDAKDAYVIAETARLRHDLSVIGTCVGRLEVAKPVAATCHYIAIWLARSASRQDAREICSVPQLRMPAKSGSWCHRVLTCTPLRTSGSAEGIAARYICSVLSLAKTSSRFCRSAIWRPMWAGFSESR